MKIEGKDLPLFRGGIRVRGVLKNISGGDEVTAGIVRRIDGKTALLDIRGEKIRAEFTGGVPSSGTIHLKLEKILHDTCLFTILERDDSDELLKKLTPLFIQSGDALRKRKGEIFRLLNGPAAGVYELNRLLIGRDGGNKKHGGAARFLNELLKLGMNPGTLMNLSMVISGQGLSGHLAYFLHSLLAGSETPSREKSRSKKDEINGIISDIINEVDRINDRDLKYKAIEKILVLLFSGKEGDDGVKEGEFVIPGDGEFEGIPYFFSDDSFIFSLNLSHLGIIEIVAKKRDKLITINVFSENEDSIEKLKKDEGPLISRMRERAGNVSVNFYNTKIMLDNVRDFYRNYIINDINVKV